MTGWRLKSTRWLPMGQSTIVQGQTQGDLVVIEKGLNPGEKVILTGQLMVIPGGPVKVAPAAQNPQVAEGKS